MWAQARLDSGRRHHAIRPHRVPVGRHRYRRCHGPCGNRAGERGRDQSGDRGFRRGHPARLRLHAGDPRAAVRRDRGRQRRRRPARPGRGAGHPAARDRARAEGAGHLPAEPVLRRAQRRPQPRRHRPRRRRGAPRAGRRRDRAAETIVFAGYLDNYFVPRGYAVVFADSLGTGGSDGCPTSGGRERDARHEGRRRLAERAGAAASTPDGRHAAAPAGRPARSA